MRPLVYCLSSLLAVVLLSCNDEASQIGSGFFEGGSIALATVDTLTLQTSTIQFDSLATSDATRLLVGYHNDKDLGPITASTYFQIGPSDGLTLDKLYTSFIRTEMRFIHDGYSFYDTTSDISFSIHALTQDMKLDDGSNGAYLYNTSSFEYDPTPLGSVTFKSKPNAHDTVKFPISEQFGRDIIRLAQTSSEEVSSITAFLNYFSGIAVIPSSNSGPIVGFKTAVEVRIYYLDRSVTPAAERYVSLVPGNNLWFNRISFDRSATALKGLDRQIEHLASSETNKKSYIQNGAGLGVRIEIPYLRSMLIENEGLTIMSAVLQFAPAKDNTEDNVTLPATLLMSSVDYKNQLVQTFSNNANLIEDVYLGRDTHYEVDVTTFIKQQLLIEQFNHNALIFTTDDASFRGTISRLYVGDQRNERQMTLKISCLTISK
jgi:hypothetical protein